MSGDVTIHDIAFDRQVTLREAYQIMERFVTLHFERGEVSTLALLSDLGLCRDGRGGDPAALPDYLEAVEAVIGREPTAET